MEAIILILVVVVGVLGFFVLLLMAYHEHILPLLFDYQWKSKFRSSKRKIKRLLKNFFFFTTKKVVRGKIANLMVGKVIVPNFGDENNNLMIIATRPATFYIIFYIIVKRLNGKESSIEIPREKFEELNANRKSYIGKNISLHLKHHFWGDDFERLLIVE